MVDGAHSPRREEEEEEQIKNLGILKDNDRLTSSSYSFIYSTTGGFQMAMNEERRRRGSKIGRRMDRRWCVGVAPWA